MTSIIRHMSIACCRTKASDTHSEYVILITTSGSSGYANSTHCYIYMYIVCPVCYVSLYIMCAVFCQDAVTCYVPLFISTALYCIMLM